VTERDVLADAEINALARHCVDLVLLAIIDNGTAYLDWENLPELGEYEWERVVDALKVYQVARLRWHDIMDENANIDRRELWDRFA
jgi:hypothetical protein